MNIRVDCPYCGLVNGVKHDPEEGRKSYVVTCDVNEGGCDRDFVADIFVSVEARGRKIEGEEKTGAAEG